LIAGLYLDDIAAVVERQGFPDDPPGRELPIAGSIWLAVRFFFVVLIVNIVALLLLLVPGVNLIAFYVGNGYLLGREYFELAAMRHVSEREAKRIRKANSTSVLLCGLVIAAVASVPILNLVTPLFATGFMVRMWKRIAAKGEAGLQGPGTSRSVRDPAPQSTRL
jgi:CysZ protein